MEDGEVFVEWLGPYIPGPWQSSRHFIDSREAQETFHQQIKVRY
jgi:hypothetical protein